MSPILFVLLAFGLVVIAKTLLLYQEKDHQFRYNLEQIQVSSQSVKINKDVMEKINQIDKSFHEFYAHETENFKKLDSALKDFETYKKKVDALVVKAGFNL